MPRRPLILVLVLALGLTASASGAVLPPTQAKSPSLPGPTVDDCFLAQAPRIITTAPSSSLRKNHTAIPAVITATATDPEPGDTKRRRIPSAAPGATASQPARTQTQTRLDSLHIELRSPSSSQTETCTAPGFARCAAGNSSSAVEMCAADRRWVLAEECLGFREACSLAFFLRKGVDRSTYSGLDTL
ncbi:hypothetical protein AAE478_007415 [Parahypoxylon ruwenzoriense]